MEVSEDKLEQLVEEKVEKRLKQRQHEETEEEKQTDPDLSRRDFLKGLAGGAAGIGAASMLPSATGYSITSSHPLSFYNQSSSDPNFKVTTEGTLDANQIGSESDPVSNIHTKTISTEVSRSTDPYTTEQKRVEIVDDAAWTWFTGPTAVYDESSNKTFTGGVSTAGNLVVGSYDHGTGNVVTNDLGFLEQDDHGNPGILVRPDGKILITYSAHAGSNIYWRISTNARDISSFGSEQSMDPGSTSRYTYLDPWYLADEDRIYLIYRNDDVIASVHSDDYGETWSGQTVLVNDFYSNDRGYKQTHSLGGSRIDMGLNSAQTDVAHVYYEDGTIYATDGTSLGSPPINFTNLSKIYDSSASGNKPAWNWDCIRREDGTIELLFAEVPEDGLHTYNYARWDGSSWSVRPMTDTWPLVKTGEEPQYSPGLCLDWHNEGVAYLSVGGDQVTEIKKWQTLNGGGTWHVRDFGSYPRENIRPRWVKNAPSDSPIVWLNGEYEMFKNDRYDTRIVGGKMAGGQSGPEPTYGLTELSYTGSGQTVSGTSQQVSFDTVEEDLRGWADGDKISPPSQEAIYLIRANIGFESMAAGGEIHGDLQIGSTDLQRLDSAEVSAGDEPVLTGSFIHRDKGGAGNNFIVTVEHNTGSDETIVGDPTRTNFEIVQIA